MSILKTGQSSLNQGTDDGCSATSDSGADEVPSSSRENIPDHAQASDFDNILQEIQELRENKGQLEESFEILKNYHQKEYTAIGEALQEERYRNDRLEERLNDLIELHQNEILNFKDELASMGERSDFQSNKEATDIHESLEACLTHLFKVEQQQLQAGQLDGLENVTARTVLGKLINVLLAVMAAILVFVSTVANCITALMRTCSRTLFMMLFVVFFALLLRHWNAILDYPKYFFCTP
ncbi:Transmembrane and coiled-coil domains protein 1 [Dissostichus eleginoides]|uniref:Transmembrane and coiled-coil domains protein 1 n=1 Tax=Dissostichus eleginoides TaxID=100907 RepID=A0AAD9FFX5_DISEL|nr:Transmembrane and coiled-coil domains protein 1 [Dissostichus eleginoides]